MNTEKDKYVRMNLIVEPEFRKKYKTYCLKNDFNMSDRIRQMIELDMKGEIKIK